MQVQVGPRNYELSVIEGRLFFNGEECLCRCDHDKAEILISDQVSREQRMELAVQAVNETWLRQLDDWGLVPFIGDVPSGGPGESPC